MTGEQAVCHKETSSEVRKSLVNDLKILSHCFQALPTLCLQEKSLKKLYFVHIFQVPQIATDRKCNNGKKPLLDSEKGWQNLNDIKIIKGHSLEVKSNI